MRIVSSKEKERNEVKKVHPSVKKELEPELISKAHVFPYRLQLQQKNYVYAAVYVNNKRTVKTFNYSELGYVGAVKAAMAWIDDMNLTVKTYLGSTSFHVTDSVTPGRKLFRSLVAYYNEETKSWHKKTFSRTAVDLPEKDKEHLRKTAKAWLDEYVKNGFARSYSNWRNVMKYNNDETYEWGMSKCNADL